MQGILAISFSEVFNKDIVGPAIRVGALILVGFPLVLLLAALAARSTRKRLTPQGKCSSVKGSFTSAAL